MKSTQSSLQQDILDELRAEPSIDSSRIGVRVEHGIVELTGQVRTLIERQAAERAAKRVRGVNALANELEVDLLTEHQRGDVDLAEAARSALLWNVSVPEKKVQVTVQKGWVTLDGRVPFAHQRTAAESAVSALTGVLGVENCIAIAPTVSANDVYRKLSASLHRYAQLEVDEIVVKADGSRVVLEGAVHSWAERDLVQEAAWNVPGVTQVDNRLAVGR
jgi:osmotically-inducible protein OsmY